MTGDDNRFTGGIDKPSGCLEGIGEDCDVRWKEGSLWRYIVERLILRSEAGVPGTAR